jgi:transposase
MQSPKDVGVDVAKDFVVAAFADGSGSPKQVSNEARELRAWLKTLPAGSRMGMEATGRYHGLLADLAHETGLTVYVLNPRDVFYYAKALGCRGKTDRMDAEVIASYVADHHAKLKPYVPASLEQRAIDRLLKRRAHLMVLRCAAQATTEDLAECRRQVKALLQRFDALIAEIDRTLQSLTQACEPLHRSATRLQTIVGIGPLTGLSLASTFHRIPFQGAEAVVAYTGFDPRPRDSGRMVGRRRLSKRGPGELRRLLYMAAKSAAQTPTWKPIYERYRARGLSSTASYVILARRILRVAWSVHSHQTDFDPARLAA